MKEKKVNEQQWIRWVEWVDKIKWLKRDISTSCTMKPRDTSCWRSIYSGLYLWLSFILTNICLSEKLKYLQQVSALYSCTKFAIVIINWLKNYAFNCTALYNMQLVNLSLGIYGHSAVYDHSTQTVYIFGGYLFRSDQWYVSRELLTLDARVKKWNMLYPDLHSDVRIFSFIVVWTLCFLHV